MIRKMFGNRRDWSHPVLVEDGVTTVMDREKVEIMAKTCIAPIIYQRRERLTGMYRVLSREAGLGGMRMLLLL